MWINFYPHLSFFSETFDVSLDYISATMERQRHFIIILITALMHAVAVAQTGLIATRYSVDNGLPMGHRTKRIRERGDEKHRKPFIYKELRGLRL